MRARRLHRLVGLGLALPMLGWAVTGLVFSWKPGYAAAYSRLELPLRPLSHARLVAPDPDWLEARWLESPLGEHLLVRTSAGWRHLDAATSVPWPEPTAEELRPLVAAAIAADPERYGTLLARDAAGVWRTSTGARITLDWPTLALAQRGRDTDRIDLLYRIHYLQWTGVATLDRGLGFGGLAAVALLAALGILLALRPG
jgi:hypothetical protein